MTESEKIEQLRHMLDDSTNDIDRETLSVYLKIAGDKVLNRMYPFKTDYTGLKVPDRYVSIQLKAACYLINKIGAEGQIQHIENGIHRNYGAADIPDGMVQEIVPYAQVLL